MAKKKKWGNIVSQFFDLEDAKMAKNIGKTVGKAITHTEKSIEKVTHNAIKASSVFVLMAMGLIFALVGLAEYLSVELSLKPGMGLMLVGGVLFLLGVFGKLVRN